MSFTCNKCTRIFKRQVYLNQHNNRKIPCDREISCVRCGKEFKQMGNLKKHLNKKNKCEDKRICLELELKIAETNLKGKETDLKIEKVKLKQVLAEKPSNTFNINNITNIINVNSGINYTLGEVNKMIVIDDTNASFVNFIKMHFNNDEFPNNKCIKIVGNKIFINENDKLVQFDTARNSFNTKVSTQLGCITNDFTKYSDEEIDQFGFQQKKEYLGDKKVSTLEKIDPYMKNTRNKGEVKKAIMSAHN